MKLVTFEQTSGARAIRPGVVVDDSVVDLVAAWPIAQAAMPRIHGIEPHGGPPNSVKELVSAGTAGRALAWTVVDHIVSDMDRDRTGSAAVLAMESVRLLPPIPDPDKFLCVGKNYRAHLRELEKNGLLKEWPQEPTAFVKLNSTLVGQDAKVARPDGIVAFDYEPELVFAIGRPAFGVKKADALDYVAGITLLNDLTAREIQKREVASGTRFWTAKNMPGFGPLGPYLITLDEIGDPYDLWITCSVNGEERLRVNTGDQIFKLGDIVEHFSRYIPLNPGDLFATGSPGGVAVGQPDAAALYLRPGDVVEVAIEGVAALRTHIAAPGGQDQSQTAGGAG